MDTILSNSWILPLFAFLVLVVYIVHDQKRQREFRTNPSQPIQQPDTLLNDTDSKVSVSNLSTSLQIEKKFDQLLDSVTYRIHDFDTQQCYASLIGALQFSTIRNLAQLAQGRHTFPRETFQVDGRTRKPLILTKNDVKDALNSYLEKTGRKSEEVLCELNGQIEVFGDTWESIVDIEEEEKKPNPYEVIKDLQRNYKFLNETRPLHQEDLEKIFIGERDENGNKVKIEYIPKPPLLSFLTEYTNEKDENGWAVVIRNDEKIHQCLKEFLLAHELGHWFLHIKTGFAKKEIAPSNYYLHSSPAWKPLEVDADIFAMVTLFPIGYLIDCELKDKLDSTYILNDFTKDMKEDINSHPRLKETFLKYIENRIKRYERYKKNAVSMPFPINHIESNNVQTLIDFCEKVSAYPINWVITDNDQKVVDGSKSFYDLFSEDRNSIEDKLQASDLVVKEDKEFMQKILDLRKGTLKEKDVFYIIRLKQKRKASPARVSVRSFPILDKGVYKGAFGIITPTEDVIYNSTEAGYHMV